MWKSATASCRCRVVPGKGMDREGWGGPIPERAWGGAVSWRWHQDGLPATGIRSSVG